MEGARRRGCIGYWIGWLLRSEGLVGLGGGQDSEERKYPPVLWFHR